MPHSNLTDRFVESLKPSDQRLDVRDGKMRGLILRVSEKGTNGPCFIAANRTGAADAAPAARILKFHYPKPVPKRSIFSREWRAARIPRVIGNARRPIGFKPSAIWPSDI